MKFTTAAIVALLSAHSTAGILFDGSFESGKIYPLTRDSVDSFYYGALDGNCNATTKDYVSTGDNRVQTNYVRHGKRANAQTIHFNCDYRPLNGGDRQKPRQSLKIIKDSVSMTEGNEYWIAFSFMLPKDWVSDYARNRDNLFQLVKEKTANARTARDSGPNIVAIEEWDGKYTMSIEDVVNSSLKRVSWPMVKGEWQDIVINYRPCRKGSSCTGFMKIYVGNKDRRAKNIHMNPIYSYRGPNTTAYLHTAAINLYKFAWHCTGEYQTNYSACMSAAKQNPTRSKKSRTVYFDEFMIGNANSSLAEVAPYFNSGASGATTSSVPNPPGNIDVFSY